MLSAAEAVAVRVGLRGEGLLVADLGAPLPCLSSAVLGGGLGRVRCWACLQVPPGFASREPAAHVAAAAAGLPGPVVGMLTAAAVSGFAHRRAGGARAVATVGAEHALAAAGRFTGPAPPAGTINILAVAGAPLTATGLVNALATVVEAKAQALAEAGVPARNADGAATGTATDAVCVACPPGRGTPFAGPATVVGSELARAVHAAVSAGLARERVA